MPWRTKKRKLISTVKQRSLFFALIRVAAGTATALSQKYGNTEWHAAYEEAQRQAVAGWLYGAIEKLPADQRPPREVLLAWYATAERIKQMNARLNDAAVTLVATLGKNGFSTCILKGQGVALLYPNASLRTPGDIDIWMSGGRHHVVQYVRAKHPNEAVRYHHIGFPIYKDVEVEAHFMPSWMNSPCRNRRLQRYFKAASPTQMAHFAKLADGSEREIPVPTASFNAVYILLHIFRHLLGEGIGLRQVADYYYVLLALTKTERNEVNELLKEMGLSRFASAMMYVQQQLFGLDDEYLITSPDEAAGRFVIDEIMLAGNFGKTDPRLVRKTRETAFYRFRRSLRRNMRFVHYFPNETLCDPVFKLWHYAWQVCHHYR